MGSGSFVVNLPPFIALCGNPGAGKSEAQKILHNALGYVPVDDGRPLRNIARDYLGLTEAQVTTQEGKAETVTINGQEWVVRDVLGEIGNAFEEKFGGDVIPLMAMHASGMTRSLSKERFSFGSVRRKQGWFYRARGGVVIEIRRAGTGPLEYAFDRFDRSAVDIVVQNDGTLEQFEQRLIAGLRWFAGDPESHGAYPMTEVGAGYRARDGVVLLEQRSASTVLQEGHEQELRALFDEAYASPND